MNKIALLNDAFRTTLTGGTVLLTILKQKTLFFCPPHPKSDSISPRQLEYLIVNSTSSKIALSPGKGSGRPGLCSQRRSA